MTSGLKRGAAAADDARVSHCPACAGLLGPGAQWCGLCYADLRAPAPQDVAAQVPPARPGSSPRAPARAESPSGTAPDAADEPAPAAPGPPALVVLPLVDPPVPVGAVQPGWPCSVCSSVVPYESDACPVCGAGFLSALTGSGLPKLPIGGAPGAASRRGTWVVTAVVLGALATLLLLGVALGGAVAGPAAGG